MLFLQKKSYMLHTDSHIHTYAQIYIHINRERSEEIFLYIVRIYMFITKFLLYLFLLTNHSGAFLFITIIYNFIFIFMYHIVHIILYIWAIHLIISLKMINISLL